MIKLLTHSLSLWSNYNRYSEQVSYSLTTSFKERELCSLLYYSTMNFGRVSPSLMPSSSSSRVASATTSVRVTSRRDFFLNFPSSSTMKSSGFRPFPGQKPTRMLSSPSLSTTYDCLLSYSDTLMSSSLASIPVSRVSWILQSLVFVRLGANPACFNFPNKLAIIKGFKLYRTHVRLFFNEGEG